jgi:hypothetical protein
MPSDNDFRTLCASDGGKYGSDYLCFDDIDRVLRHRGDVVYVRYLDIRTTSNNTYYSEIHDQYILCRDARYDEEIGEYLFSDEYDKFNNTEKINERREYLRKRREEMEKRESQPRRKKSTSSWIESLVGSYSGSGLNENIINDVYQRITENSGIPQGYFGMYNEYIDSVNNALNSGGQMGRDPQLEDNSEPIPEPETEQ